MLLQIMMVGVAVSLSCAILGVFLVLKGATMVSDAITHTVLLGIVLGYFIVHDLNSPILLIGATIIGVVTVWAIEALRQTGLVEQDAATGFVFPFLFAIALILMTRYAGDVHLDVDAVFMGQLGFTVFDRVELLGMDIGPRAFWNSLIIFLLNSAFVSYFYKELKVSTFDQHYAHALGVPLAFIHYGLMTLVSLTAVGAFQSVGSILVVGFLVGPALTGYLLSDRLASVIGISLLAAVFNSVVGIYLAYRLDLSYAGVIAAVTGVVAFISFLFSPRKGALKGYFNRRKRQADLIDQQR